MKIYRYTVLSFLLITGLANSSIFPAKAADGQSARRTSLTDISYFLTTAFRDEVPDSIKMVLTNALNHLLLFHHKLLKLPLCKVSEIAPKTRMGHWLLSRFIKDSSSDDPYSKSDKAFLIADALIYLAQRGCLLPCEKNFIESSFIGGGLCGDCLRTVANAFDKNKNVCGCSSEELDTSVAAFINFVEEYCPNIYCDQCIQLIVNDFKKLPDAVRADVVTRGLYGAGDASSILLAGNTSLCPHAERAGDTEFSADDLVVPMEKMELGTINLCSPDFVGYVLTPEEMRSSKK